MRASLGLPCAQAATLGTQVVGRPRSRPRAVVALQLRSLRFHHPPFMSRRGLFNSRVGGSRWGWVLQIKSRAIHLTSHKTTCLGFGGWIPIAGVWGVVDSRGPSFFANTSFWLFQALFRRLGFCLAWLPASSYLASGLTLTIGIWSLTRGPP